MLEKVATRYALSWAEPQISGQELRWRACWEVYASTPAPSDQPLCHGRSGHWTTNQHSAAEEARRLAAQAARDLRD